jgi:hypothetical protein
MKINIHMTKKKWIIAGVVGILLLIVLVPLIFGGAGGAIADLQTEPLGRGQLTAIVGATGSVHANQSTVLSWQMRWKQKRFLPLWRPILYHNR